MITASRCVASVGRNDASTSRAGFACVSRSRHFATSSQNAAIDVNPDTPATVAV